MILAVCKVLPWNRRACMGRTIDFLPDPTIKNLAGKSTVALLVALSGRQVFYGTAKRLCNPDLQFVKGRAVSNRGPTLQQWNIFRGIVLLG